MQEKKSRELKGDGLRVEVEVNDSRLEIVGDGCRVTVTRNTSSILIIGDGSSIRVTKNEGEIEYRGDGGRISLGKGSKTESVNYIGDGGKIIVCSGAAARESNNKSRIVGEDRSSVSDSEFELRKSRFKENIEKDNKKAENERRKKSKGRRRCENYNVVTKIISKDLTKIDTNDIIKNLFINPPSVFKSFKFYSAESL